MTTLRTRLIRLAHAQPSLRGQLLPLLRRTAKEYIRTFNNGDWQAWNGSEKWKNGDQPLAADLDSVDFEEAKVGGVTVPAGTYSVALVADSGTGSFSLFPEDGGDDYTFYMPKKFKTQADARKAMEDWLGDLGQGTIPSGFKIA